MCRLVDKDAAEQLILEAKTCRYIDSRRLATSLVLLSFDDASTCTSEFARLIQTLLMLSDDKVAHYVVLDPDPISYFHHHFTKYPIVCLHQGETEETYFALLHEDPGGSPADAFGINCYEWVILAESHRWFVHCLRASDSYGGHLWIPSGWVQQIHSEFDWLDYPAQLSTNVF